MAFNKEEQASIKSKDLVNEKNSLYGTTGGNDTLDNIFLLSISEITIIMLLSIIMAEYVFPVSVGNMTMMRLCRFCRSVYRLIFGLQKMMEPVDQEEDL